MPKPPRPSTSAIHAVTLFCETCAGPTEHRVLRWSPAKGGSAGAGRAEGLARCRVCHLTRPFLWEGPARRDVAVVLSDGGRSRPERWPLPASERIAVGEERPSPDGSAWRVVRIDRSDGTRVSSARPEETGTVWLAPARAGTLPVSVLEGRRTRSVRWTPPDGTELAVGGSFELDGDTLRIVGLRARGATWKVPGDRFAAPEVARIYARRNVRPPEGSRGWSRARESPSSFASALSRSARSRSSPGPRRKRA